MTTATKVLETYWDGKLPVSPVNIAKAMGIAVRANPVLPESGMISLVDGKALIEFCSTEAPVRRRFTVAHEIGHFALGHLKAGTTMFRDPAANFSSRSANSLEREANAFAAQMLMPAETLRYAVIQKRMTDVGELANAFGVSQVAMSYRLQNLGLLSA